MSRDAALLIPLSTAERNRIHLVARLNGMTTAGFVREAILQEILRRNDNGRGIVRQIAGAVPTMRRGR